MELKSLLKHRTIWMAFAIIWLICYHAQFNLLPMPFDQIENFGYLGVDIFLFASGIGCYYSLEKDSDILHFVKRRFNRLMPTYWCFIVIWILFKLLTDGMQYTEAIGNFLGIEFLVSSDSAFNWYISAIWIFYFLAPFFKLFTDRHKSNIVNILFVLILIIFSIPFWFANIELIFVSRLSVFYLGLCTARLGKEEFILSNKHCHLLIAASLVGCLLLAFNYRFYPERLLNGGLFWYPSILIVPGLCLIISLTSNKLSNKLSSKNIVNRFLNLIGNNTFELYLVHLFIYEGLAKYISGKYTALICFAAIIPGCMLLKLVSKPVTSFIIRLEEKVSSLN